MDKKNIRFTSAVLSLALATGIALSSPSEAFAKTKYKQGTFIEYTIEDADNHYNKYVVKTGDNLSRISGKICKFFGEKYSTEYWPTIAFLNDYPRVLRPSDIIVFPETFEEMVLMNENLKASGWTSRYIQSNDIYGRRKQLTIRGLLQEIYTEMYGDAVNVDDDFIRLYLKTVNLSNSFDVTSSGFDNNQYFALTQWIPTLEELGLKSQEKTEKSK